MIPIKKTILLVIILCSSVAWAGGDSSGGGDSKPLEHGSTWFLGQRKVRTCFEVSSRFGVSDQDIRQTISAAFEKWRQYYAEKYVVVLSNDMRPAFAHELLAGCDGSEDLRIHFGTTSPEVETAMQQFSDPIAFAHRSSYDLERGWGKGFIWVMDSGWGIDWSRPYALQGILLHELGHVYGCDHVAGTIMTEEIRSRIRMAQNSAAQVAELRLGRIDGDREVLFNPQFETAFFGKIGGSFSTESDRNEVFQALLRREITGPVNAELKISGRSGEVVLFVTDNRGTFDFPISILGLTTRLPGYGMAFKVVRKIHQGEREYLYREGVVAGEGAVIYGNLRAVDGAMYPVVLERNTDEIGGRARLRYYKESKWKDLFFAVREGR